MDKAIAVAFCDEVIASLRQGKKNTRGVVTKRILNKRLKVMLQAKQQFKRYYEITAL